MSKFTPGPWQYVHSDPAEGCDVWWITGSEDSNREKEIATVPGGWPWASSESNARLIAAAPELLAALTEMVDRWEPDTGGRDREMWERAVAAIEKAWGD